MLQHEKRLWKQGYTFIAGVDEAGRGPLAGPVCACACILPKGCVFEGVNDSKQLSPHARKRLEAELVHHPEVYWALGVVLPEIIDQINILQATLLAMRQAILALPKPPDYLLIDGRDAPIRDYPLETIIKGDTQSQSIAAASIIAKVRRDAMMQDYHRLYPQYGFDKHKGYGTKQHLEALQKHGPCPIHRTSFALL